MHRFSEYHIKLKEKNFPQNLHLGDWVYIPSKNDYMRVEINNPIPPDYIKAPKLTTMLGLFEKYNYTLKHKYLGEDRELWILDSGDIHIEDENINIALIKFWLSKKG